MKVSRDIGEPIQLGSAKGGEGAKILDQQAVEEIVKKMNGRERVLRDVWNIISRDPKLQEEIEEWIRGKTSLLAKRQSV
jgi:hypothetical protein